MAAEFVALADLLRAPASRAVEAEPPELPVAREREPLRDAAASESADVLGDAEVDVVDAVRGARLFRARLADAFDDAVARLLRELATGVLGRELRLAPCDLAALVRRVGEGAPVVRVRVAACDVASLDVALLAGVPVLADPALERGDAVVELAGGALDARLGVRLATVLEAFA